MIYCINPTCSNPADPGNASAQVCRTCGTSLVLQNRYRAIAPLGQGGFGQTFTVEDLQAGSGDSLSRHKVLKILVNSSPKAIELFQREAEVMTQIQHPGIPKLAEDGWFEFSLPDCLDPLHCLVMEKIHGLDLEVWLSQRNDGGIAQELACNWLKQLGEILNQLHQNAGNQYFHRDIKPRNITMRPTGELVLIDFGGVRKISPSYLAKAGAGHSGTGIVSLGYTPSEQIRGKAVPQSDFFALGRTMVHLLTGQHPMDLEEDPQTGELMWRDYAPQISPEFAELIDWLMAPFPGQRPTNTTVMLDALEGVVSGSGSFHSVPRATGRGQPDEENQKIGQGLFKTVKFRRAILAGLTALLLPLGFRVVAPQVAIALNRGGIAQYRNSDFTRSQQFFRLAIALQPDFPDAHYNLGSVCEDLQDIPCARQHYWQAAVGKLDIGYNNLARLEILDQNYSAAVILLREGLRWNTQTRSKYSLLKNLGWALLGLEALEEAEVRLEEALALDGERGAAHCLLAQVLDAQGKTAAESAWHNCLKKANENNPDEKRWQKMAAEHLIGKGNEP
ncbi:serine/threonine protein kinase [Phormidium sp. CCY1219]|uniref:serine/threonine protein kinase n=1 Tax=Phormidium sp. CCY1219 TaxID=2886104 RepID=UPI002D1F954E|nr:serine/threonine-protein kinase [Phormidium sp. CCY1219]MEB3831935.1 serine/threonine-protein kinase [Phormidium sp. CCY1219]